MRLPTFCWLLCLSCGGGGTQPPPDTGHPEGACQTLQLPAEARRVDTSSPDLVVGDGTKESCTFEALKAAVSQGGVITFACGEEAVTVVVTEALKPPTSNAYANEAPIETVIDGGGKVTLDAQRGSRIIEWNHEGHWQRSNDVLTLQGLRFINGKATPKDTIATCTQAPNDRCASGFKDGQGGAVYVRDGALRVIGCTFEDNEGATVGPDTGGGALYVQGTAHTTQIATSAFRRNKASNGGAVGLLFGGAFVSNSYFQANEAVGTGANAVDPTGCGCQGHQVGSGGNGGALYKDGGDNLDLTLCGAEIVGNAANAFGAGVFLTANGSAARLRIHDSSVRENQNGSPYWQWCPSVSTDTIATSPQPVSSLFCQVNGDCTTACGG